MSLVVLMMPPRTAAGQGRQKTTGGEKLQIAAWHYGDSTQLLCHNTRCRCRVNPDLDEDSWCLFSLYNVHVTIGITRFNKPLPELQQGCFSVSRAAIRMYVDVTVEPPDNAPCFLGRGDFPSANSLEFRAHDMTTQEFPPWVSNSWD